MQYIKIIGDTHSDALRKLRDTYGSDAIVYYEKEIPAKTVMSRLMGKKQFMIQAALTEKKKETTKLSGRPEQRRNREQGITLKLNEPEIIPPEGDKHEGEEFLSLLNEEMFQGEKGVFDLEKLSMRDDFDRPQKQETLKRQATPARKVHIEPGPPPELRTLQSDIDDIKEKISILIKNPTFSENRNEVDRLRELLAEQEFSPEWITEFIQDIKSAIPSADWNKGVKVYNRAKEVLSARIKVSHREGSKRVIALVGPTGVGKTTTIAKLAARWKLQEGKSLSLITLDNYRIAATEQLKVYGDIMDIPVFVLKDPESFHQKIEEDHSEIILVDTTGFNPGNNELMTKMSRFFEGYNREIEKHLVVSATSRVADAKNIIEKFQFFEIDRMILSKLDETTYFGGFVELLEHYSLPFSYFTNGQRVPDDFLKADKGFLAEQVLARLKEKYLMETDSH